MLSIILALCATVVLLVFMGYFMLGSLPLLVLKHDTPLDARFIRNFFQLYYRAVFPAALAAAAAYGLAGHVFFCGGMLVLAGIVFVAWRRMLPTMDAVRATMAPDAVQAIARFRRLHIRGMLLNALQLAGVAGSLVWLKL